MTIASKSRARLVDELVELRARGRGFLVLYCTRCMAELAGYSVDVSLARILEDADEHGAIHRRRGFARSKP